MKRTSVLSWLGTAATLAFFVVACGDDDDDRERLRPSEEGESCVRSSDCQEGLSCINNFCSTGADVGEGGSDSGPAPGPILGAVGESCTRRADCQADLLCIEQRCVTAAPTGDGGEGNVPAPRFGNRGDSCATVSDCAVGLTCVQRMLGGICDLQDYGLEPTGKSCGGECVDADDCCELPLPIAAVYGSCENLLETHIVSLTANCPTGATQTPAPAFAGLCFIYRTYCDCATNTWDCTDNRCTYTAECAVSGPTWRGCPAFTRASETLSTVCTDEACTPVVDACEESADCEGLTTADLGNTCVADECVCHDRRCYRGCDENLDCPVSFSCVEDVCTASDQCASNAQCATRLSDATAECRDGACVIPCTTDQDCSDSGARGGGSAFNSSVCGPEGTCQQLGCSSDEECTTGPLHTFCVAPPAATTTSVRSAITD